MEKNQFVDIAKLEEIPPGKMKHAETDGNEVLVANVEGIILWAIIAQTDLPRDRQIK
jgi:nitrite reductase/ring-hydroxylating ferredoxin subunit